MAQMLLGGAFVYITIETRVVHFVKLTWQPTVVCRLSNHPTGCNLPPKLSFHQSVLRWAFQVVHWMIPRSKAHIFVWWNVWVGILLKTIMKQQSNKLFLWSWIARDAECFLGVGTAEIDGIPACNDGFRMFLLSQTAQPSCIWQAGCALRTNISRSINSGKVANIWKTSMLFAISNKLTNWLNTAHIRRLFAR